MGSFSGFEIAKRAIMAHQTAIDITSNNIANAATEGYTRRRVQLVEARPASVPVASGKQVQVGSGVDVETINRIRSSYADVVVRQDNSILEQTRAELDGASRLDSYLSEPGDSGFGEIINEFWSSFSSLQIHPDDKSLRENVIEAGRSVTVALKQTNDGLTSARSDVQASIISDVDKINDTASQIAVLNDEITDASNRGHVPLDLLDDRDRLIDDLSKITDVKILDNSDGTVSIISGNAMLVDRKNAFGLSVKLPPDNAPEPRLISLQTTMGAVFKSSGGKLNGELKFINEALPDYKYKLDTIAVKLKDSVNEVHRQGINLAGSPGGDFFIEPQVDPTDPTPKRFGVEDLALAVSDPGDIAVDTVDIYGTVHYGANALALSKLRDKEPASDNVNALYTTFVTSIGSDVEKLTHSEEMYSASLEQGLNLRDQVSGVSIDEETMNLVKYEAGYNAAAKIVSVLDEMLKTIIGLGN